MLIRLDIPRPDRSELVRTRLYCRSLEMIFPEFGELVQRDPTAAADLAIRWLGEQAFRATCGIFDRGGLHAPDFAPEVVSDLLLCVAGGMLDRYDCSKASVRTFVVSAMRNIAKGIVRRERKHRRGTIDPAVLETKPDFCIDDAEEAEAAQRRCADRLARIAEAFDTLSHREQLAVKQVYPFLAPDLNGPADAPDRTYVQRCRAMDKISAHPAVNGIRHGRPKARTG